MEEKRASPRKRVLKGARIVMNDGFSTLDCRVRNLSEDGALLQVASVVGVPDSFDLLLSDGHRFKCHVTRRAGEELGVQFAKDDS